MGSESHDWQRTKRRRPDGSGFVVGVLIGLALILAASPQVSERLGYTPPLGIAGLYPDDGDAAPTAGAVPASPDVTVEAQASSPPDPWAAWLADEATCPRGDDGSAPVVVQVQALLCLVNYARAREGLRPLALSSLLNTSAEAKARDIVRCRDFSHEACGRASNATLRDVGYRGSWGENLYAGEGPLVTPRAAVDGWLHSRGHRENLFHQSWRTIGIAVAGDARLERIENGVVWVNHFGD